MKMQTGKRLIFIKGGKESWHFQIYSDGTEKWRLLLQQPADQHAAQETSRRKSLQPAGQPAAQEISRRRNPQPADQHAARQISRRRSLQPAGRPAAQGTNNLSRLWGRFPAGRSGWESLFMTIETSRSLLSICFHRKGDRRPERSNFDARLPAAGI